MRKWSVVSISSTKAATAYASLSLALASSSSSLSLSVYGLMRAVTEALIPSVAPLVPSSSKSASQRSPLWAMMEGKIVLNHSIKAGSLR